MKYSDLLPPLTRVNILGLPLEMPKELFALTVYSENQLCSLLYRVPYRYYIIVKNNGFFSFRW